MMPRYASTSMASPFLLIVLFTGCSSDYPCLKEGRLTAILGAQTLTSPNYPEQYEHNLNCSWKIRTENDNEVVRLFVLTLDLEGSDGCRYDSLSIYDAGRAVLNQRLASLCGSHPDSETFNSTGRYMYIRFLSDSTTTSSGFRLLFTAVKLVNVFPGSTSSGLVAKTQRVETARSNFQHLNPPGYPGPYNSKESILWNIVCDPGHVVHLRVSEMDLQNSSLCVENRVTVWDSDNVTLLATMCNHLYEGVNLYSTGHVLHVHFTSGPTVTGNGFSMLYRAVGPDKSRESYRRTSTSSPSAGDEVRSTALVFAIIGCCLLVAAFVWIVRLLCHCKWPLRSASSTSSSNNNNNSVCRLPRPPLRSASSTSSSNNNTLYRLPRPLFDPTPAVRLTLGVHRTARSRPTILPDRADSAETNGGMPPRGEGPPPYSSLQFSPQSSQPASAASSPDGVRLETLPPPPSYTDSMIIRHPPSKKK